jgi:hypothetical protein
MSRFMWGFGFANCLWAGGAFYLQLTKVTLLMWGGPGDAAGAVIMGTMVLLAIILALMSPRARDVLTVGALLIGFGAVAARAALAG